MQPTCSPRTFTLSSWFPLAGRSYTSKQIAGLGIVHTLVRTAEPHLLPSRPLIPYSTFSFRHVSSARLGPKFIYPLEMTNKHLRYADQFCSCSGNCISYQLRRKWTGGHQPDHVIQPTKSLSLAADLAAAHPSSSLSAKQSFFSTSYTSTRSSLSPCLLRVSPRWSCWRLLA